MHRNVELQKQYAWRLASFMGPYEFPGTQEPSEQELEVENERGIATLRNWQFSLEENQRLSSVLLDRLQEHSIPFVEEAFGDNHQTKEEEKSRMISLATEIHVALSQAERGEEKPLYLIRKIFSGDKEDYLPQVIFIASRREAEQPLDSLAALPLINTIEKMGKVIAAGMGEEISGGSLSKPTVIFTGFPFHFLRTISRSGGAEGLNFHSFAVLMPFHHLRTIEELKQNPAHYNTIFFHELMYSALLHFFGPQKAAFLYKTPRKRKNLPSGIYENHVNRSSNGFLNFPDHEIEQLAQISPVFYENVAQQIVSSAHSPLLITHDNFISFPIIKNGERLTASHSLFPKAGEKILQRSNLLIDRDIFSETHLEYWLGYHLFLYLLKALPETPDIYIKTYELIRNFIGDGVIKMKGQAIREMAEKYNLYQLYQQWLADPEVSQGLSTQFCQSEENFNHWLSSLDKENNETYLIFSDGRPIGHIRLKKIDRGAKTAAVGLIIGDEKYRKRDIGSTLFKRIKERAAELELETLTATVRSTNSSSREFFRSLRPRTLEVSRQNERNLIIYIFSI